MNGAFIAPVCVCIKIRNEKFVLDSMLRANVLVDWKNTFHRALNYALTKKAEIENAKWLLIKEMDLCECKCEMNPMSILTYIYFAPQALSQRQKYLIKIFSLIVFVRSFRCRNKCEKTFIGHCCGGQMGTRHQDAHWANIPFCGPFHWTISFRIHATRTSKWCRTIKNCERRSNGIESRGRSSSQHK